MVNAAIRSLMEETEREIQSSGRKCKVYKTFKPEQRAAIGKHAAENGNGAEVKRFKAEFDERLERVLLVNLSKTISVN